MIFNLCSWLKSKFLTNNLLIMFLLTGLMLCWRSKNISWTYLHLYYILCLLFYFMLQKYCMLQPYAAWGCQLFIFCSCWRCDVHSLISNFWQTKISFVTEMEKNLELQIRIGESKNIEMWFNTLDLAFEAWTPLNITSENLKKWGQISEQEQWIHLTIVKH